MKGQTVNEPLSAHKWQSPAVAVASLSMLMLSALSAGLAVTLATTETASAHGSRHPVIKEERRYIRTHTLQPDTPESYGGPFELTDHNGRTVTDKTFHGKWSLYFFGYTGCREACPLGLENITQSLELLGPEAKNIQPLFIDVGMEAPDRKGLAQFVANFHPSILGLAGTRAQTFDIVRHYKIRREYMGTNYSKKEFGPQIDHTTYIFLVDPAGKTRGYYHHALTPAQMADFIREHL